MVGSRVEEGWTEQMHRRTVTQLTPRRNLRPRRALHAAPPGAGHARLASPRSVSRGSARPGAMGYERAQTEPSSLLFLAMEIVAAVALSTWDLVFRFDPPGPRMYEVADIALGEFAQRRLYRALQSSGAMAIRGGDLERNRGVGLALVLAIPQGIVLEKRHLSMLPPQW